jgi:hypothetical protein
MGKALESIASFYQRHENSIIAGTLFLGLAKVAYDSFQRFQEERRLEEKKRDDAWFDAHRTYTVRDGVIEFKPPVSHGYDELAVIDSLPPADKEAALAHLRELSDHTMVRPDSYVHAATVPKKVSEPKPDVPAPHVTLWDRIRGISYRPSGLLTRTPGYEVIEQN